MNFDELSYFPASKNVTTDESGFTNFFKRDKNSEKKFKYIECSALTQKNLKATFDSAIIVALENRGKKKSPSKMIPRLSLRRFSSFRKSRRSWGHRSSTHSGSSSNSEISNSIGESTYSKTFNPDDFEHHSPIPYLFCLG